MYLPQLFISMLLFIVLFFGIGFLLNMLLRSTWVMAVIYPVVVVMIVDHVKFLHISQVRQKAFLSLDRTLFICKRSISLFWHAG